MRDIAEKHFHGEEGFNCAQAVLKTFQDHYEISDDVILEHKKSGGGRVEGNICGALHAATLLADDETVKEIFHQAFIDAAGSDKCKEIKQRKELSCRSCSGVAAELLDKHHKSKR